MKYILLTLISLSVFAQINCPSLPSEAELHKCKVVNRECACGASVCEDNFGFDKEYRLENNKENPECVQRWMDAKAVAVIYCNLVNKTIYDESFEVMFKKTVDLSKLSEQEIAEEHGKVIDQLLAKKCK